MLVSKDNPNVKRVCYHKDLTTKDETAVNANEAVYGWCGSCKDGAKKNCRKKSFIDIFFISTISAPGYCGEGAGKEKNSFSSFCWTQYD